MTYPGGKESAGVYQRLISEIPPHRVYVEPFCGHAAILRHKRPAERSIAIDRDPAVIRELHTLPGVPLTLEALSGDAIDWLYESAEWLQATDAFVFADPPYLATTRRDRERAYYRYDLTVADHRRLLEILDRLDCKVMLCGYWSQLYAERLKTWRTFSYEARTRGGPAVEWVWCNYPLPDRLHDPRYWSPGDGFRGRQDWHRFRRRWCRRFSRLPPIAQQILLDDLAAIQGQQD